MINILHGLLHLIIFLARICIALRALIYFRNKAMFKSVFEFAMIMIVVQIGVQLFLVVPYYVMHDLNFFISTISPETRVVHRE